MHNGNAIGAVDQRTASEPELIEAAMDTAGPTEFAAQGPQVMSVTPGELVQMLEDLQPRVRELESVLAARAEVCDGGRGDQAEAINDAASIIATIKDLQQRNEIACGLKESLDSELAETKRKLTEAQSARAALDARAERLEEECAWLEGEQSLTVRRLREATSRLKLISEDRDRLAEQKACDERRIGELERSLVDAQSQPSRQETAAGLGRLRRELSDTTKTLDAAREESRRLKENTQSLKGKLDAMEVSKNSLELELTTTRGLVCGQNEQIEELTENLQTSYAELATVRAALTRQEVDGKNLAQSNERAEHEMKILKVRIESMQEEIDLNRQALREIRTATTRTMDRDLEHN